LEQAAVVQLPKGNILASYTTGGGGYGSPIERPAARVVRDVAEGWISHTRARDVYGVVLADDGQLDIEATKHCRQKLSTVFEA